MEDNRKIQTSQKKPDTVQRDVNRNTLNSRNKNDGVNNRNGIKSGQSYSGVKLRTGADGNNSSPANLANQRFLLNKRKFTAGGKIQTAKGGGNNSFADTASRIQTGSVVQDLSGYGKIKTGADTPKTSDLITSTSYGSKIQTAAGNNNSSLANQRFLLNKRKFTAGSRIQTAKREGKNSFTDMSSKIQTAYTYAISYGETKTKTDTNQYVSYHKRAGTARDFLPASEKIQTAVTSKTDTVKNGVSANQLKTQTETNTANSGIQISVTLKTDTVQHGINHGEIRTKAENSQVRNVDGIKTNTVFVLSKKRLKNKRYSSVKSNSDLIKHDDSKPPSAIKTQVVKADTPKADGGALADNQRRSLVYKRAFRMKQMRLQNHKYITAKPDSDNSLAIESAMAVQGAASAATQVGGHIRTAVKNTSGAVGHISTSVKYHTPLMRVGSSKDMGRIMTAAGGGLKNAVTGAGNQLLQTKIDKSKIIDTGTEAIKQGLTDMRHVSNAGKAVVNTARTSVKTAYTIKNMPQNTRIQVRNIKRNAKKAAKAAKKTAEGAKKAGSVIIKAATSKAGLIIILAVLLIIITSTLFSGLTTTAVSSIVSLFSWMFP